MVQLIETNPDVPKVLHETRERGETKEYLDDLLNMYKSVFQVRVHPAGSRASEVITIYFRSIT